MKPKDKERLINLIVEIVVIACSFLIIIPLLVMIFGSFKTSAEALKFNALPPTTWEFANYSFVIVTGQNPFVHDEQHHCHPGCADRLCRLCRTGWIHPRPC